MYIYIYIYYNSVDAHCHLPQNVHGAPDSDAHLLSSRQASWSRDGASVTDSRLNSDTYVRDLCFNPLMRAASSAVDQELKISKLSLDSADSVQALRSSSGAWSKPERRISRRKALISDLSLGPEATAVQDSPSNTLRMSLLCNFSLHRKNRKLLNSSPA